MVKWLKDTDSNLGRAHEMSEVADTNAGSGGVGREDQDQSQHAGAQIMDMKEDNGKAYRVLGIQSLGSIRRKRDGGASNDLEGAGQGLRGSQIGLAISDGDIGTKHAEMLPATLRANARNQGDREGSMTSGQSTVGREDRHQSIMSLDVGKVHNPAEIV